MSDAWRRGSAGSGAVLGIFARDQFISAAQLRNSGGIEAQTRSAVGFGKSAFEVLGHHK